MVAGPVAIVAAAVVDEVALAVIVAAVAVAAAAATSLVESCKRVGSAPLSWGQTRLVSFGSLRGLLDELQVVTIEHFVVRSYAVAS